MYTEITTGKNQIILDELNVFPRTVPHLPDRHLPFLWYGITKTWAGNVNPKVVSGMMPRPLNKDETIYVVLNRRHGFTYFEYDEQMWAKFGMDVPNSIAIFSFADGSYAAWNSQIKKTRAFSFPETINGNDQVVSGTAYWTRGNDPRFRLFLDVLNALIHPLEISFSRLVRASLEDCRDMLGFMVQGNTVPLTHLSFPFLRTVTLAWLIVHEVTEWNIREQLMETGESLERVFLFVDETPKIISPKNLLRLPALLNVPVQSFLDGDVSC